jgi:hypothetical protein
VSEPFLHGLTDRCKLWTFGDHRAIDVQHPVALPSDEVYHFGEKFHRIGATILLVCIGKVASKVAQPDCTEECLCAGVGHNISVALPDQAGFSRKVNAAEHELPISIGRESVNIEPIANAQRAQNCQKIAATRTRRGLKFFSHPLKVSDFGDLEV